MSSMTLLWMARNPVEEFLDAIQSSLKHGRVHRFVNLFRFAATKSYLESTLS